MYKDLLFIPPALLVSNKNFLANLKVIPELVGLREDDSFVSILPYWHIFERVVEHVAIVKNFASDLEEFKSTVVATVPRVWESLYAKINATLSKQSSKKDTIFNLLVKVATKYNENINTNCLDFIYNKFVALIKLMFLYFPNKIARKKFKAI